jgi:hypothetical protein
MNNPHDAPKAQIQDPALTRRSLKGLLFVPLGMALICLLFLWLSFGSSEALSVYRSAKFWFVCFCSSLVACSALVALRMRPSWFLSLLAPLLSLIAFVCWVTAENLITGRMSW